jgi:hypothetical protein
MGANRCAEKPEGVVAAVVVVMCGEVVVGSGDG